MRCFILYLVAGWMLQPVHPAACCCEVSGEKWAVAALETLGVKIKLDEKAPGKPAVEADFGGLHEGVTAEDLAPIRLLTSLRRAEMGGTRVIDDVLLDHLTTLKNLEYLGLCDTYVTDRGMECLSRLTNLKELDVAVCWVVTDRGMKHIGKLKNLEVLWVHNMTKVSDTWLPELKGLKKLRELDLSGTGVTDRGVARLRQLPALEKLDLWGNYRVTDRCLPDIRAMPKLRWVQFSDTVSVAGVESLRKARPALEVAR